MLALIYVLHVLICIFLILVVLLQQGSGADLSVFGGGGTQTAFGARSATQIIHKLTVWAFVGFIVTTLAIAFLRGGPRSLSVMRGVDEAATVTPDAGEVPPGGDTVPADEPLFTPDPVPEGGAGAIGESDEASALPAVEVAPQAAPPPVEAPAAEAPVPQR